MNPRVAAIQLCSTDSVDENLQIASALIKEAAQHGAQLIVLPEMFPIIGKNPTDVLNAKERDGSGKIQDFLSHSAAKNNVWIVGGTIPIASNSDSKKINAACLVYDQCANRVARYDKMHLFDAVVSDKESYRESDIVQAGTHSVVIDTPMGRLGLAVCFDIRFPLLFSELSQKGAKIIALPSAFTVKTGLAHWELLVRARAVDTFCYVIGAAQGGTHVNGRQTYGHAMIVDPWGAILSEMNASACGIVYADIDHVHQEKIRRSIPVLPDQQ